MSVQGGVEEMKSGRVMVTAEVEPMTDIWFYQDGFIKNKVELDLKVMTKTWDTLETPWNASAALRLYCA